MAAESPVEPEARLPFFQQGHVGHAEPGQVVEGAGADGARRR